MARNSLRLRSHKLLTALGLTNSFFLGQPGVERIGGGYRISLQHKNTLLRAHLLENLRPNGDSYLTEVCLLQ
jgi:hypothetical protein